MTHESQVAMVRELVAGRRMSAAEAMRFACSLDEIPSEEPAAGAVMDRYLAAVIALMAREPSSDELVGIVRDIAQRSISIDDEALRQGALVDVSGTGGDGMDTPNVGSLASFVIAAGGVAVAKQATRAFSGVSGSSDVYRHLGLDVMRPDLEQSLRALRATGITALHTPTHSPSAFRRRMELLRRLRAQDLTFATPWHLASWAYSPFPLSGRVYGVYADRYRNRMAEVFARCAPRQHTLVVHGVDGIDEISVSGPTTITEIRRGRRSEFRVTPEALGLTRFAVHEMSMHSERDFLRLRSPRIEREERVEIRRKAALALRWQTAAILGGTGHPAHEALVVANAGAGLYVGGAADSLAGGVALARDVLSSGSALAKLSAFTDAVSGTTSAPPLTAMSSSA